MTEDFVNNDIFPLSVTEPNNMVNLEPFNFQTISAKKQLRSFITFLNRQEKNIVCYRPKKYNVKLKTLFEHFERSFEIDPNQREWNTISKQLLNNKTDEHNIDCRLSYTFNEHFFIVPRLFTTGLRKVKTGFVHCYEVGSKSLVAYTVTKEKALNNGIKTKTRSFVPSDQWCFTTVYLKANTIHIIPTDIFYVICTYTPAYFSMYIFPEQALIRFPVSNVPLIKENLPNPKKVIKRKRTEEREPDKKQIRTSYYDHIRLSDNCKENSHSVISKSNKTDSLQILPPTSTPILNNLIKRKRTEQEDPFRKQMKTPCYDHIRLSDSNEKTSHSMTFNSNETNSLQIPYPTPLSLSPPTLTHTEPTLTHTEPTLTHTEPTLTHTEPTLTHTEPTLTHTEPTLTHTEPTLTHTEPTLTHTEPTLTYQVITLLPLEREIKIASPNAVEWFQKNFQRKQYDNPFIKPTILDFFPSEPLDLRTRIRENSVLFHLDKQCQFPESVIPDSITISPQLSSTQMALETNFIDSYTMYNTSPENELDLYALQGNIHNEPILLDTESNLATLHSMELNLCGDNQPPFTTSQEITHNDFIFTEADFSTPQAENNANLHENVNIDIASSNPDIHSIHYEMYEQNSYSESDYPTSPGYSQNSKVFSPTNVSLSFPENYEVPEPNTVERPIDNSALHYFNSLTCSPETLLAVNTIAENDAFLTQYL